MSTSIEPMPGVAASLPAPLVDPGAKSPGVGQNVTDDPVIHAMRGVLWSVTLARAVLVPVFLVGAFRLQELVAQGADTGRLRGGLVLTLAAIAASDMLDGWLARRFGLATETGAIADALADKLAQVALVAFFAFAAQPPFAALPIWFFALLVGRDLLLGAGLLSLRVRGVPFRVVHRIHGRAATVGVFALLLWLTAGLEGEAFAPLMLLTAALIWVSIAAYIGDAWTAERRARGLARHGS